MDFPGSLKAIPGGDFFDDNYLVLQQVSVILQSILSCISSFISASTVMLSFVLALFICNKRLDLIP